MKKFIFIFLLFSQALNADTKDSLKDSNKLFPLKYYTEQQFEYADSVNYVENTLLDFQNYLPLNLLGNTGLASADLIYHPSFHLGFNYSKNYFGNYYYAPKNILFYNTRIPYTDLFVVFGTQREQYFKSTLSYNIRKNWNATINFSRIKGVGFYQKQVTDHTFFAVSSNYKSLNNRYYLLFEGALNLIKNQENGGMLNDSLFYVGGAIYNPALTDATNKRLNKNIFLKQYFNIGKRANDTTPIIAESRFILASSFDSNINEYKDTHPLNKFYRHIYYDSLKTHDSLNFLKVENELSWKRVDNLKHRGIQDMIGVGIGVKHQYVKIFQQGVDTTLNNILLKSELTNLYSKRGYYVNLSGEVVVNNKGYNKDDYELQLLFKKVMKREGSYFQLLLREKEYSAPYIYSDYYSNHFKWQNNFQKTKEQKVAGALILKQYDFSTSIDFTSYSNVFYFDTLALANQYTGTVQVLSIFLNKNFKFYNWHLNNSVCFQQVPDSSVIRVPQYILKHSLYYENDLFKKALHFQIGFQGFYTASYYANAYMPATGQFFIQDKRKYGNYPVIDFFVNLKIKVVNIFFKIEHLNAGFMGNNYVFTPGYPVTQRAFRLGVSWKFWD